jgi:hypothetical protein
MTMFELTENDIKQIYKIERLTDLPKEIKLNGENFNLTNFCLKLQELCFDFLSYQLLVLFDNNHLQSQIALDLPLIFQFFHLNLLMLMIK